MIRHLIILSLFSFLHPLAAQQLPAYCGAADRQIAATDSARTGLERIREAAARLSLSSAADTVRIVPVVVHVMHDNGWEKIGPDQVRDGMRKLNEDFRRRNADTAMTRGLFRPYAADCYFEFRLARIDPDGNCTDGITYHATPLTYHTHDTIKTVAAWPSDRYFNIWIVNTIDAEKFNLPGITVIGYEQFPWVYGINETYGAVVKHDYWGNTGTGINHTMQHTEAHEVGHCFGLFHPWHNPAGSGDGCDASYGSDCADRNDLVCDTPPVAGLSFGCDTALNSCSGDTAGPSPYAVDVADQAENFMGYGSCRNMFTLGQKQRMDAVFQSYPDLLNLISSANHLATGVDTGYAGGACPPVASFTATGRMACAGDTVAFSDESWNGAATWWSWQFPGGSPTVSSSASPAVMYTAPGIYDVMFTAGNAAGSDTVEMKGYIEVFDAAQTASPPFATESFEDSASFYAGWRTPPSGMNHRWQITDTAAFSGSRSIMVRNLDEAWHKETLSFVSPCYDLSAFTWPELTFRVAYAAAGPLSGEVLNVYESFDCGQSWSPRWNYPATALSTAPEQTAFFVPSGPGQWQEKTVPLSAAGNVRVRFELMSFKGNNIYVDDINIREKPTGMDDLTAGGDMLIHPNPTSGSLWFEVPRLRQDYGGQAGLKLGANNMQHTTYHLHLFDIYGRTLMHLEQQTTSNPQLDIGHLPAGVYALVITYGKARYATRIVRQ